VSLKKLVVGLVVVLSMVVAAPRAASASTIAFTCITNNTGTCGAFAGFYTGTVTVAGNLMTLTVSNSGPGSIADIYADAPGTGTGYALTSIFEGPGVDYLAPNTGSPSSLPSGNNAVPAFDTNFFAVADNPSSTDGVNSGEFVSLIFTLSGGQTQAIIDNLLNTGGLRFGIHVQGLGTQNTSEALVSGCANCGPGQQSTVPEPASMVLLGTGLLAVARARHRKTS
jgi:PEP-CTERM motif